MTPFTNRAFSLFLPPLPALSCLITCLELWSLGQINRNLFCYPLPYPPSSPSTPGRIAILKKSVWRTLTSRYPSDGNVKSGMSDVTMTGTKLAQERKTVKKRWKKKVKRGTEKSSKNYRARWKRTKKARSQFYFFLYTKAKCICNLSNTLLAQSMS